LIYAFVRFMENAQQYSYLSNDSRIQKDDVVIVPTPKGEKYGIVENVMRCNEKNAPYPPEKTKCIVKIIGHKTRVNWAPEKPMLYVSNSTNQAGKPAYWIHRRHWLSSDEYECSYCKYCYDNRFPICPNCRKHMVGHPSKDEKMREVAKTNSEIVAAWIAEEHLFGEKTYCCENCKATYSKAMPICPNCKAKMIKEKNDPVWVDEMAIFDEEN